MTQTRQTLGHYGEKIARTFLQRQGFLLEANNWRHGRLGEIDLIMYHPTQGVLAFIEVKTRKGSQYGSPAEAITPMKQERMRQLAELYLLQRHAIHAPETSALLPSNQQGPFIRFDLISIHFPGQGKPADIQHMENAF